MEISEVRIKLMNGGQDRLLGFCSITIEQAFVIRDLKIIRGDKGPFVAMPSRKLTDRCPECSSKNALRSAFCSSCGKSLGRNRSVKFPDGRARLYADIAHPINCECRDLIQQQVLVAYDEELILSQQPGYVCRYDDLGEFEFEHSEAGNWSEPMYVPQEGGSHRWDDEQTAIGPHEPCAEPASLGRRQEVNFGDGVF
ncbi:septation protein SpoVG family protein [Planctomicrobium sp. SH527]|uniref:septation protein SpoVG family protein n=1 Tax=Planctomicrobium sp. SH527 TaxID=3448123 RepID=UPI003F5C46C6